VVLCLGGFVLFFCFYVFLVLCSPAFSVFVNYIICGQISERVGSLFSFFFTFCFFTLKMNFQSDLKYKWKTNFLELQNLVTGVVFSSK